MERVKPRAAVQEPQPTPNPWVPRYPSVVHALVQFDARSEGHGLKPMKVGTDFDVGTFSAVLTPHPALSPLRGEGDLRQAPSTEYQALTIA